MRIKTYLIILAAFIATKSFAQQKSESKLPIKYDVSGTLTGYKSTYLYFELLGIQSLMKLDSVKNQGGKFTFKFDGGISEPGLFRIRAGKDFNTTLMFIVSEKHNNITIQGD